jgi:hypothetical protein
VEAADAGSGGRGPPGAKTEAGNSARGPAGPNKTDAGSSGRGPAVTKTDADGFQEVRAHGERRAWAKVAAPSDTKAQTKAQVRGLTILGCCRVSRAVSRSGAA